MHGAAWGVPRSWCGATRRLHSEGPERLARDNAVPAVALRRCAGRRSPSLTVGPRMGQRGPGGWLARVGRAAVTLPHGRASQRYTGAMTTTPRRGWWNPRWGWKTWAVAALMVLPTLGFAVWVLLEAGGESPIDPGLQALAEANAGGPVVAISGTEHTIYHSPAPLPTAAEPRADGRRTVVWFTSPSCARCDGMLFVHRVMSGYREQFVFVEKSIGRDTAGERYGIDATPAFLVIDASGKELGRFGYIQDEEGFRRELARFVAQPD